MNKTTGELIKTIYTLFDPTDTLVVKNPFDEDFRFTFEGADYIVKAGDQAEMLGYMANLYVKKVVDEMMQRDLKLVHLTDKNERQVYVDQIVIQHRPAIAPVNAAESGEPKVLSRPKTGALADASYGQDVELPPVADTGKELTSAELERLHPTDDGKGGKLETPTTEEIPFPGVGKTTKKASK